MFFIHGYGIKITEDNCKELKTFVHQFDDRNKSFSWGYYCGFDIYEKRFKFTKNPNTISSRGLVDNVQVFKDIVLKFLN